MVIDGAACYKRPSKHGHASNVMNDEHEIVIIEEEFDGEQLLITGLSAEPVETLVAFAPDNSEDSRQLLLELALIWDEVWPKLKDQIDEGIKSYGVDQSLGRDQCGLSVSRMEPGYFMSDQSDLMLRFEFLEPPLWDCFLKGKEIAHFQAVF